MFACLRPRARETPGVESVGGYRLVRLLARGAHGDAWLGATDVGTALVAIKLFHAATPTARVDAEVEALGRASHRHIQRLLDISLDPQGRTCLVLERLGPSLARVLAERDTLSVGEAVTVLAPVSLAVAELHRVGVAHGRVDAGSVLLDDSGAPVLARFGRATLEGDFPHPPRPSSLTPAEQAANEQFGRDRDDLAGLADQVLSRVDGVPSVLAWLRQLTEVPPGFSHELAERLFAAGPAVPLALQNPVGTEAPPLSVRESFRFADTSPPDDREEVDVGPAATVALPPWLDPWVERLRGEEWVGGLVDLASRARDSLRQVRRRTFIAAAVGLAAFVVALAALGAPPAATPGADATVSEAPEPLNPPTAEASQAPSAALDRADVPTDPIDAADVLLARREQCLRELSVVCLGEADQPGSAAMDADTHRILQAQQGSASPRIDWSAAELDLADELGDGALVRATVHGEGSVDGPGAGAAALTATILLVRTDEGWRIRDLIE